MVDWVICVVLKYVRLGHRFSVLEQILYLSSPALYKVQRVFISLANVDLQWFLESIGNCPFGKNLLQLIGKYRQVSSLRVGVATWASHVIIYTT